jgi:hypothetical protein
VTTFLAGVFVGSWVLIWLDRQRPDPGEFDDIETERRKLAALARARKDQP